MSKRDRLHTESGHRAHYPIKRSHPLYTQYRTQRRVFGITNQEIANQIGVALTTVARELGLEPHKPMSSTMAQRLGDALGFDPAYVALAHARDIVFAQSCSTRIGAHAHAQLKRVLSRLDSLLRMQPRFVSGNAARRLSLRAERCRRGVTLERLRRHADSAELACTAHILSRYEAGLGNLDDRAISAVLPLLSALSPNLDPVSMAALEQRGAELVRVHDVSETIEWHDCRELAGRSEQVHCPYETGYDVRVGTSPTAWPLMDVRLIQATQPKNGARSLVRIIGLQPRGIQIGVLIQGKVELTLSESPFPRERTEEHYEYKSSDPGVVHQHCYEAGTVLVAPGKHFYRMELRGRATLLALISIRGNLTVDIPG